MASNFLANVNSFLDGNYFEFNKASFLIYIHFIRPFKKKSAQSVTVRQISGLVGVQHINLWIEPIFQLQKNFGKWKTAHQHPHLHMLVKSKYCPQLNQSDAILKNMTIDYLRLDKNDIYREMFEKLKEIISRSQLPKQIRHCSRCQQIALAPANYNGNNFKCIFCRSWSLINK